MPVSVQPGSNRLSDLTGPAEKSCKILASACFGRVLPLVHLPVPPWDFFSGATGVRLSDASRMLKITHCTAHARKSSMVSHHPVRDSKSVPQHTEGTAFRLWTSAGAHESALAASLV